MRAGSGAPAGLWNVRAQPGCASEAAGQAQLLIMMLLTAVGTGRVRLQLNEGLRQGQCDEARLMGQVRARAPVSISGAGSVASKPQSMARATHTHTHTDQHVGF